MKKLFIVMLICIYTPVSCALSSDSNSHKSDYNQSFWQRHKKKIITTGCLITLVAIGKKSKTPPPPPPQKKSSPKSSQKNTNTAKKSSPKSSQKNTNTAEEEKKIDVINDPRSSEKAKIIAGLTALRKKNDLCRYDIFSLKQESMSSQSLITYNDLNEIPVYIWGRVCHRTPLILSDIHNNFLPFSIVPRYTTLIEVKINSDYDTAQRYITDGGYKLYKSFSDLGRSADLAYSAKEKKHRWSVVSVLPESEELSDPIETHLNKISKLYDLLYKKRLAWIANRSPIRNLFLEKTRNRYYSDLVVLICSFDEKSGNEIMSKPKMVDLPDPNNF